MGKNRGDKVARAGLKHFLWLWLLLWTSQALGDAPREMRFQRLLEGSEPLKRNASALMAVVQDSIGFMWFGGENGLARFDGTQFKRYEPSPHPGGLPSNIVRDLLIDHDGVMWVATDRGLARYHPETDHFDVFQSYPALSSLPHNVITSLAVDAHNTLVVGTGDGISLLNAERDTFVNLPLNSHGKNLTFVLSTFVDSKNRVWVGTREHGLFVLSAQGDFIRHYVAAQGDPQALQSDTIKAIGEDPFGRIWVGTLGGGASRLAEGERHFVTYMVDEAIPGSIGSNTVWDIYRDSADSLWLSTDQGGLALYQPQTDSFVHYRHSPFDRNTLTSDQVQSIYEDRDRNLWITTFPQGINYYDRNHSHVTNYTHQQDRDDSLSNSAVLHFMQTTDGLLWIGTENGLNLFDVDRKQFVGRYMRSAEGLQANAVLSLIEDPNGEVWVGTWGGGLHRLDRVTERFYHYAPDRNQADSLNSAYVWQLYLDSRNTLWVATETGGLNRYHRDTDSFAHYVHDQNDPHSISSNFVWAVLEDSRERFWVATVDGLDILDRDTGRFYKYPRQADNPATINSLRIRALMEDSAGRVWIGTQDIGAVVFDYSSETFTQVPWPDSLGTLVTSFIEDNLGYVWASTANGIARINPQTLRVRSFHRSHGLVGDNFNRNATFKDRRGQLYFGGTEGFSVFNPRAFMRGDNHHALVLTDFRLFNRPVAIGEPGSPLDRSISHIEELHLKPSHAMFSFVFAVLDYRTASENRYAYKLDGFDQDWHHVGSHNSATYTSIGPGDYLFQVKSTDRDGNLNRHQIQLRIKVLAPWWRSVWAYGVYALSLALLGALLVRMFIKHLELGHQRALNDELLRINRIKDAFMVNAAHELRAPVSSMISLAEATVEDPRCPLPDLARQRIEQLVAQGKRLFNQLNDVLDYGNLAEQRLEVNAEAFSLHQLAEAVMQLLRPMAYGKPVRLVNQLKPAQSWVMADRSHLKQVLSNLLSNALKHTAKGEVRVGGEITEAGLQVWVEDTGTGIAPELRDQLFKPKFNRGPGQRHVAVGMGLTVAQHLLELHGASLSYDTQYGSGKNAPSGTRFSFTLPLAAPQNSSRSLPWSRSVTAAISENPAMDTLGGSQRPNLLIVDDDPVNRMVLDGMLRNQYQIREASSGPEALQILLEEAWPVDLVILDVMMPRMSGFEVCQRLRQDFSKEALPIIFLTAKHSDEDIAKGLAMGGNEVLYKPVRKEVLVERLAAYRVGGRTAG